MRELFPKIEKYSFFISLILILMGACIADPVDLEKFLEDEKVQEIIENGKEKVGLHPDSDSGLTATSSQITGLNADKYYIVEIFDENMVSQAVNYVSKEGVLVNDLNLIGRVTEKTIINLNRNNTYLVKSAVSLLGNVTYFDLNDSSLLANDSGTAAAIANGSISIKTPKNQYYLNLVPALLADGNYNIVMVSAVNSASTVTPLNTAPDGMLVIALQEENTTTDYVIAENNDSGGIESFRVLSVVVSKNIGLTFNIDLEITDSSPVLEPFTVTISQDDIINGNSVTFSLTLTNYNKFDQNSVNWMYNGEILSNGRTMVLTANDVYEFLAVGTHIFYVSGTLKGIPYSAVFEILCSS